MLSSKIVFGSIYMELIEEKPPTQSRTAAAGRPGHSDDAAGFDENEH